MGFKHEFEWLIIKVYSWNGLKSHYPQHQLSPPPQRPPKPHPQDPQYTQLPLIPPQIYITWFILVEIHYLRSIALLLEISKLLITTTLLCLLLLWLYFQLWHYSYGLGNWGNLLQQNHTCIGINKNAKVKSKFTSAKRPLKIVSSTGVWNPWLH